MSPALMTGGMYVAGDFIAF